MNSQKEKAKWQRQQFTPHVFSKMQTSILSQLGQGAAFSLGNCDGKGNETFCKQAAAVVNRCQFLSQLLVMMIPINSCELFTSFWDNIFGSLVQFAKELIGLKIAQSQGPFTPLQCLKRQKYT